MADCEICGEEILSCNFCGNGYKEHNDEYHKKIKEEDNFI